MAVWVLVQAFLFPVILPIDPEVRVQERFALAILGCTGVGKSALTLKFVRQLSGS